jgi:hypothetical protein
VKADQTGQQGDTGQEYGSNDRGAISAQLRQPGGYN